MFVICVILLAVFCGMFFEPLTADPVNAMFKAGMTITQFYAFEIFAFAVGMAIIAFVRVAGLCVFGRLAGFRFRMLQLGRRALVKSDGKYSLKRYKFTLYPQLFMLPPEGASRIRWAIALTGGVLACLIAAAAFLLLSRVVSPAFEFLLVLWTILFGFVGICDAIPMKMRGGDSSGKTVLRLFRDGQVLEMLTRNYKVMELGIRGIRVKDMPAELFTVSEAQTDDMIAAVWSAVYATRLMDEGRYAEAKEMMRSAVNSGKLSPQDTAVIICDAIMCEAAGECDMEKIRKMLTPALRKYMKKNADMPYVLRTCYIEELLLNKNADAAQKIRVRFEKSAADYLKPGVIESGREYFEIIDKKAKEIA